MRERLGFETIVIEDATRPVNLPGSVAETNAVLADHTFQTLMGDEVEPRRLFIEQNAKFVSNLDI